VSQKQGTTKKQRPSSRKQLGLPAKAGKRHGPHQSPPDPGKRLAIIKHTREWCNENPTKAFTDDIRESVESLVPGNKPIKLQVIPGTIRPDLLRAMRGEWFWFE